MCIEDLLDGSMETEFLRTQDLDFHIHWGGCCFSLYDRLNQTFPYIEKMGFPVFHCTPLISVNDQISHTRGIIYNICEKSSFAKSGFIYIRVYRRFR